MNSYTTNFLIILIYRFLVVCIMLPISFLNISLMHELINIFFLVIHLVKRVIVFMILVHKKFFSLEMWFFTKIYSYFYIPVRKSRWHYCPTHYIPWPIISTKTLSGPPSPSSPWSLDPSNSRPHHLWFANYLPTSLSCGNRQRPFFIPWCLRVVVSTHHTTSFPYSLLTFHRYPPSIYSQIHPPYQTPFLLQSLPTMLPCLLLTLFSQSRLALATPSLDMYLTLIFLSIIEFLSTISLNWLNPTLMRRHDIIHTGLRPWILKL